MYIRLAQFIFQYLLPPPDELFGGTWEVFGTGRTLVGISSDETEFNTVEKTGGEKTHKLTSSEMPSHNHSVVCYTGGGSYGWALGNGQTSAGWQWDKIGSTGGNGAHNNLQPYITVYMWKRTA